MPALSDDGPVLCIRDLQKDFVAPDGRRVAALRLGHLDLARSDRLAVLGESGSGKTTLLHVISGVLPADRGTVEILGTRMTGRGEGARDRLRARHIGYLFQSFNLLPHLDALENVALGMLFRPTGPRSPRSAARDALERVGLGDRLRHRPSQLSVGQQQRVAIARALAGRPALVLADEPTASLDARRAEEALELLLDFCAECRAALLVVTHDDRVLQRFSRRLALETPRIA